MTINMVKQDQKSSFQKPLKARDKVLNFFFLNEEKEAYINELARIIGADPKNVHRILSDLEKEGILGSHFKGRERYFFSRKSDVLYESAKQIFIRTKGLAAVLKNALKDIKGVESAMIYGSYAAGDFGPMSDIDLLVIGGHGRLELQRALYKVQEGLGREINTVNMKKEEFEKKKSEGNSFVRSLLAGRTIKVI